MATNILCLLYTANIWVYMIIQNDDVAQSLRRHTFDSKVQSSTPPVRVAAAGDFRIFFFLNLVLNLVPWSMNHVCVHVLNLEIHSVLLNLVRIPAYLYHKYLLVPR